MWLLTGVYSTHCCWCLHSVQHTWLLVLSQCTAHMVAGTHTVYSTHGCWYLHSVQHTWLLVLSQCTAHMVAGAHTVYSTHGCWCSHSVQHTWLLVLTMYVHTCQHYDIYDCYVSITSHPSSSQIWPCTCHTCVATLT